MKLADWITTGSVAVAIGPVVVGVVWITWAAVKADEKDEV